MKTVYEVARLLAYVTGLVNQELLLQVEYLAAENRILRAHVPARLRLSDPERATLAEIGKRLGRKGLAKVAQVAKPETILGWFRKLVAQKFDGSKHRSYPGRRKIASEVERLIVQMARENSGWGYDRIAGALANLGHNVSDQTVGNVLRRNGISSSKPETDDGVEGLHRGAYGGSCGHGLLYRRGAYMARSGDVLCSVCDAVRDTARNAGRHNPPSDTGVDGTGWPQSDRR